MQTASKVLPRHASKFSNKLYTQPQLLACLILKAYCRFDYRSFQQWLETADAVRRRLRLKRVPDYSTLCWFFNHKLDEPLLQSLLQHTVRAWQRHQRGRAVVALDSTGFEARHVSRYYRWRRHEQRGQHGWPKWAIAVWVQTQLICAQHCRAGPRGDFDELPPLARAAQRNVALHTVLADAGYDSEANHRFCRQTLGVRSIIPARGHRPGAATTAYRRAMQQHFPRRLYGQRWKAETVFSVVKRKFGDAVSARRDVGQYWQLLLLGVTYNLHRLQILFVVVVVTVSRHNSRRVSTEQGALNTSAQDAGVS